MHYSKAEMYDLSYEIIGSAISVHKELGPGLLENVYHTCMKFELQNRNISFESEVTIPVYYKGISMQTNLRCDLLIENRIIVELKAVEKIIPIHNAQLLSYMRLLEIPKGIIFNFNCANLNPDGIKSLVNNHFSELEDK
jgi:GxxExxY protein